MSGGRAAEPDKRPAEPPAKPPAKWPETWFASAAQRTAAAWRGVEAQHIVATMRLVDTLDEQAMLEQLLEASKPALPPPAAQPKVAQRKPAQPKHCLLTTPFRYRSPLPSRFRSAGSAGVWYGAETLQAAAAEVAYWRWRFLTASVGLLEQDLLTEHTFFQAQVQGTAIDLTESPWVRRRNDWTRDADYSATKALAQAARARGVQWIRYASVRDPGGRCAAVFDVDALHLGDPTPQQTWHCKVSRGSALMLHGNDRFAWQYA